MYKDIIFFSLFLSLLSLQAMELEQKDLDRGANNYSENLFKQGNGFEFKHDEEFTDKESVTRSNSKKLDKMEEIDEFEKAVDELITNKASKEVYIKTLRELGIINNIYAKKAAKAAENMSEEAYLEGLYSQ